MSQSMWSPEQKVEVFKAIFLNNVSELLDSPSAEGKALLNYLQRLGKQLNIRDFDVRELVSEATMRGLALIDNRAERIDNTQAWLRKVCTFILYDMVKDEKKNRRLKAKNKGDVEYPDPLTEIESDEKREALNNAFNLLSCEDQKILDLRFYQGRKYKDIQEHFLEETGVIVKVATLRKRESRAVKRLREKFWEEYT